MGGGFYAGRTRGVNVPSGIGLLRGQELLPQVAARRRRRIFRRMRRIGATWQAGHPRVVVRVLEEHDRLAPTIGYAVLRRIDDAVQGRDPAVLGPARQHVPDVDDEAAGSMRYVEPVTIPA